MRWMERSPQLINELSGVTRGQDCEESLMINLLKKLLPFKNVEANLEKELQKALAVGNQKKAASTFCKLFRFLLKKEKIQPLSQLILSYAPKIENITSLENEISSDILKQAVTRLEEKRCDSAALMICDYFSYDIEAMCILAKRGRANDLAKYLAKSDGVDKELLHEAVIFWESYQGSIKESPVMSNVLIRIAQFAPEAIPDNPRAKEAVGQFAEAAALYVKEGDLRAAARCYENAEMYEKASRIYEDLGDREKVSRAAEASGDLEKALKFAINPERKVKLLIETERFIEAREFASGLRSPDEYFELIKERAAQRMEVRAKAHNFIGALEFADIAECEADKKEEIVRLGREHLDRRLQSAESTEDITAIYRERVELEKRAGHFEEAGKIAEEVLKDLDLASSLYEMANLFHKAIGITSGLLRLAQLHERGGSLLEAARLYESAEQYDKAFELYESIQQFHKAIECYLKTTSPAQEVLIRLLTSAGEFERVVEIYMQSEDFPDLERALDLATIHQLPSHIRAIKERLSEFACGSVHDLEGYFAIAKDEVLNSYVMLIGIDFGTTNSVVAIFNRNSRTVEIVPNAAGASYEPSFFGVDEEDRPVFGEAARLRSLTAPDCVVARVKRSLGKDLHFSVKDKHYRGEEIVACFLQHLRSNAVAYVQSKVAARFHELVQKSGLKFPAEALSIFLSEQKAYIRIEEVVLSVPAFFNDNQKKATRDAADIAGLRVLRLLHEPSAAALAYDYQKHYTGKLAVIDFGGGTLDISIVDMGGGVDDVRAIGGDTRLGGSDIDALLVEHVTKDIKERWGISIDPNLHRSEITRLRDACERLKINLSSVYQDTLELRYFLNRPSYMFTLTRAELERLSKPILDRTAKTIERTLKDHGSTIDSYVLVGNATKMPAIGNLANKVIPAKRLMGLDPGTIVAIGAVLAGATLKGESTQLLLLDVVPYSLGIAALTDKDEKETIRKLIERNSRIPTRKADVFTTKEDNQPNVHIKIYQGESPQPLENYLLGDFILEGILPALAHVPKIEVSFDIDADCILTVTARDMATGKQQSIKIERAAVLSFQEKENLRRYFAQREGVHVLEKELEVLRQAIDTLRLSCDKSIGSAEHAIKNFLEQFGEKVELNPRFYKVQPDQIGAIQAMFVEKDQFVYGLQKYRDRLISICNNIAQIEGKHLDFSGGNIVSDLRDRIDSLSHYKQALKNLRSSVEKEVLAVLKNWIQTLDSMEPDTERMDPVAAANYHLISGRTNKAKALLESLASGAEGLTEEAFRLLLKCQVLLGLREEYRDTHRRYGYLFGLAYPDFNHLNAYLRRIDDSIFMIYGIHEQQQGALSGSGFCIAPNLIVTNRHVVERMVMPSIEIIGKSATYKVVRLTLDPINDLAVLRVNESLPPLRLGYSGFVEPGEQVFAIGFPAPSSKVHNDNIYISKGIVNSIRTIEESPERVIFVDTRIGSGMSGGALINDLGEVVGIITFTRYGKKPIEGGLYLLEDQPVALPVYLLQKYLPKSQ